MTSGGGPSRNLPDGFHTVTQAANILGVSPDTLRRWRTKGLLVPSGGKQHGKTWVPWWTNEDLDRGRALIRHRKIETPDRKET